MTDFQEWQQKNAEYLAAALAWLRLRLVRLAGTVSATAPGGRIEKSKPSRWFLFRKRRSAPSVPESERVNDKQIASAAQVMEAASMIDPPPALLILGQRLSLSRFEQEILLLCAAMELDTRIPALCSRAQGHPERPYPTFALAFTLFENASWDALSADRPLRYWRLIEISQSGATPLTSSALRADERIVNYLKGLNQLDDRLSPLLAPFDLPADEDHRLSESHEKAADAVEAGLRATTAGERPPVVQLTGIDSISKQQVALQVLSRMGWHGFRLPVELLPSTVGELETLTRLWQRESTLLPLALYIDAQEANRTEGDDRLNRFIALCGTPTIVDGREPRPDLGPAAITLEVEKPSTAEQQVVWKELLGEGAGDNPALLAGQFNLNLPAIRQIALSVLARERSGGSSGRRQEDLWETCLSRTRPRLDRLAERIEPKATWEDLVLSDEPLRLLHQIGAQVGQRTRVYDEWGFRRKMSRGFGISALFAGESGTGKTMAAEVIANDLNLNLYRIDLSAVVSKYIGETEKNLRRVFDAAEDGGVILFFDEADALFGKRSEVKDSHDRYANIEINYLLQRMEAYRGLAILATNRKRALDPAFLRRLRFVVNFPFPGAEDRKKIWERAFPGNDDDRKLPGTPVDGLDYDRLAGLSLTGGSIHNVALSAAFLAARAGTPVTMPLLFEAARTELRKLERPVNEADLRSVRSAGISR